MFKEKFGLSRRMIVVDIENVNGGAVLSVDQASWARKLIEGSIAPQHDDQVVVGSARIDCLNSGLAWPEARLVVRDGADGADLALLEVLDENLATRFSEVVIVSGDHIFAESIFKLKAAGIRVTVVGHRGRLATALRFAADETIFFPSASSAFSRTNNYTQPPTEAA